MSSVDIEAQQRKMWQAALNIAAKHEQDGDTSSIVLGPGSITVVTKHPGIRLPTRETVTPRPRKPKGGRR